MNHENSENRADDFWCTAELWRGLSLQECKAIRERFSWRRNEYTSGRTVALMGDPLDNMMMLERGSLSAEIIDPQGKVLKIETLQAGAVLAGPVLFSAEACLPVQLTAEQDCAVLALAKPEALRLLGDYPRVLQNFLCESGDKILFLAEKIRLLRFASIREKLAGHFLELARRQGSRRGIPADPVHNPDNTGERLCEIRLGYSLEALADLFGVTRPALSRCLGDLVDEGLAVRRGKGVYGVNCSGLGKLLES
ncbi:MAG: Crp/Fnr family transcriptional regulator [Spirochaeta sp.]